MTQFLFVEDAFVSFYDLASKQSKFLLPQDINPCINFYDKIKLGEKLTVNQGSYILKILSKYKSQAIDIGLIYDNILTSPSWKNDFRVLDLSKEVFVEVVDKSIEICLRFPFSLKSAFEKEIEQHSSNSSRWDHDRKIRVIEFSKCNIIQLYEFCCNHGFNIDDSFRTLVSQVEEVWNNQESIVCHSKILDDLVLVNAPESAIEYYENNKSTCLEKNIFLAKTMGYPIRLENVPTSNFEKICSTSERMFWLKSMKDFFEVYKKVGGTAAVLLDRNTTNVKDWLLDFVNVSDHYISRELVKVCFREENTKNSTLNMWIKDNNLGGKVEHGKILIFQHKPPKWLFSKDIDVKIVITNSFTPINEPISNAWINHHQCVIYVGNIKPTPTRNQQFVNL